MRQISFSPDMIDLARRVQLQVDRLKTQSRKSKYWIYIIRDPISVDKSDPTMGNPFYVGETNNPARRADQHITSGARASGQNEKPVYRQIYNILQAMKVPEFELVEEANSRLASLEAEHKWIQKLTLQGYILLNESGVDSPIIDNRRLWGLTVAEAIESKVDLILSCKNCEIHEKIPLNIVVEHSGQHETLSKIRKTITCPHCMKSECLQLKRTI